MGDDFGLGRVWLEAVGGENGAVVCRVSGTEVGWHRQRIVEVGKRTSGMRGAGVENGLGGPGDCCQCGIVASSNVASFQLGIEIGSCGSQNEVSQGAGDLV